MSSPPEAQASAATRPVKFSFVVPAYNEEKLLPRTLEAIFAEIRRSRRDAEVIVVDNASTDRTHAVASRFEGTRIVSEPVKSLARARQAGFMAATGQLVANIDADTVLPEGWLDRAILEFDSNPSLVALSGPYVYDGIPRHAALAVWAFYAVGFCFYLLSRFVIRTGSMLQGGNFIVTREALELIGGYRQDFAFYGEDTDVACRLAAIGDVKFTFNLWAHSSGRRLVKEGLVRMGARYAVNFAWTTLMRRPFTRTSKDIR